MQDVVNMWNTPQRTRSYIILGVKENKQLPHDLLGLEKPESNLFYQRLFHEYYFTTRPVFICYHIELDRKHFNVIGRQIVWCYFIRKPDVDQKW